MNAYCKKITSSNPKRIITKIESRCGKNWKGKARKSLNIKSDASSAPDEAGNESEPSSENITQLASPESGICDACWKLYDGRMKDMEFTTYDNTFGYYTGPLGHIRSESSCCMCHFF